MTRPTLVILSGGKKPVRREMEGRIYAEARGYRDDYLATRRIGPGSWPPPVR